MVKRTANTQETEPEQSSFEQPSAKEHLFQVVDVKEDIDPDPDIVHVKCEVVGGDEEGRTLLNRLSLDDNWKGFFATRLFLKVISQPYKGQIEIDTDEWIGCQFYATVVHNGKYANIKEYNFEKIITQTSSVTKQEVKNDEEVSWDE